MSREVSRERERERESERENERERWIERTKDLVSFSIKKYNKKKRPLHR